MGYGFGCSGEAGPAAGAVPRRQLLPGLPLGRVVFCLGAGVSNSPALRKAVSPVATFCGHFPSDSAGFSACYQLCSAFWDTGLFLRPNIPAAIS